MSIIFSELKCPIYCQSAVLTGFARDLKLLVYEVCNNYLMLLELWHATYQTTETAPKTTGIQDAA